MQQHVKLSLSALVLFSLLSCHTTKMAATSGFSPDALYGYQWVLADLGDQHITSEFVKTPFIEFKKGDAIRFSGNAGCNNIFGSVLLGDGNKMTFSPIGATKMACPGISVEPAFIQALGTVTNWSIENAQLILWNQKTMVARFNPKAGEGQNTDFLNDLAGYWDLNYIAGQKTAFKDLFPNKIPLLIFSKDDPMMVNGNTGCNSFSGRYFINGTSLSVAQPMAMTMMACPGNGEAVFLNALQKVNKYNITNGTLSLLMGETVLLRFSKSSIQK